MTEYKQVKKISLAKIYDALPVECDEANKEFDKFCRWAHEPSTIGFFDFIFFNEIEKTFDEHPEWRDFLLEKDFIEKDSTIYHCGQDFQLRGNTIYKLSQVDKNLVVLISMKDGNGWHFPPTSVTDASEITEGEFVIITGHQRQIFRLVE